MKADNPEAPPVRVFVVEDDAGLRAEFEHLINGQQGLVLAGSADSVAEGRRGLAAAPCDVAIIDLGLPDGDAVVISITDDGAGFLVGDPQRPAPMA